jgi:hypothetical protein
MRVVLVLVLVLVLMYINISEIFRIEMTHPTEHEKSCSAPNY